MTNEPFTYTMQGDCLELMKQIPDGYVDLILCDLPYGTTQNKWDKVIDLTRLWEHYKRICKGAIVLTAAQPFTSVLVCSNIKGFKYQCVWEKPKHQCGGFRNAAYRPMNTTEDILVFSDLAAAPTPRHMLYNPQGLTECNIKQGKKRHADGREGSNNTDKGFVQIRTGYPTTVLRDFDIKATFHPTQKPVALMEYMIKTYTNEGMIVLDNCMCSGTTGIACVNTKRSFIGIEQSAEYFELANKRIEEAKLANVAPVEAVWK